jgi:hypothetical protein
MLPCPVFLVWEVIVEVDPAGVVRHPHPEVVASIPYNGYQHVIIMEKRHKLTFSKLLLSCYTGTLVSGEVIGASKNSKGEENKSEC